MTEYIFAVMVDQVVLPVWWAFVAHWTVTAIVHHKELRHGIVHHARHVTGVVTDHWSRLLPRRKGGD